MHSPEFTVFLSNVVPSLKDILTNRIAVQVTHSSRFIPYSIRPLRPLIRRRLLLIRLLCLVGCYFSQFVDNVENKIRHTALEILSRTLVTSHVDSLKPYVSDILQSSMKVSPNAPLSTNKCM